MIFDDPILGYAHKLDNYGSSWEFHESRERFMDSHGIVYDDVCFHKINDSVARCEYKDDVYYTHILAGYDVGNKKKFCNRLMGFSVVVGMYYYMCEKARNLVNKFFVKTIYI